MLAIGLAFGKAVGAPEGFGMLTGEQAAGRRSGYEAARASRPSHAAAGRGDALLFEWVTFSRAILDVFTLSEKERAIQGVFTLLFKRWVCYVITHVDHDLAWPCVGSQHTRLLGSDIPCPSLWD